MTKYNFKTTNVYLLYIRFTFSLIVTLTCFSIIALNSNVRLSNQILFISSFLLFFFIIYSLIKRVIIIDVNISFIDKSKFEIELKYFFLRKRNYTFYISDIKSYLYEYGNGYKIFHLNKKKGKSFKFLIFTEPENLKLFDNFYNNFKIEVEKHNTTNGLTLIEEEPSIYRTKLGLFYGIIIFLALITIPICYIIFERKINIGYILILYPVGILFLWRLYNERKK